jgi:hypothetical protein
MASERSALRSRFVTLKGNQHPIGGRSESLSVPTTYDWERFAVFAGLERWGRHQNVKGCRKLAPPPDGHEIELFEAHPKGALHVKFRVRLLAQWVT